MRQKHSTVYDTEVVRYRAGSYSVIKATPMQTLTTNSTQHLTLVTITLPDLSPKPEQCSEEDINSNTLMILADIEAERDYYESCGRW
jgi:hypothetical protein